MSFNPQLVEKWTQWAIRFHNKWRGEDGPPVRYADWPDQEWPYETFVNGHFKQEGAAAIAVDSIDTAMEAVDENFAIIAKQRLERGHTRLVWRQRPFLDYFEPYENFRGTWMIYMRFAWLPAENKA